MLYFQESFAADGVWWLLDTPEHRVVGTLSFDPDTGVRLALSGMLRQLEDAFANADDENVTIHGVTNKGQFISLFQCFSQSRTLNFPGSGTEQYHADVAAAGLHFSSSDEPLFSKSYFRFDGIEKWLGESPFESGFDSATRIMSIKSRTSSDELLLTTIDQKLSVSTNMRTQQNSDIEIALISEITLVATPHEPKSLDWHMDNAWKVQRLASLCMGRHLPSQTLRLTGPVERVGNNRERPITVDVLASMMFPSGNRRSGDLPVISARELVSACPDALTKWLDQFDSLGAVLNLLTTVIADKSLFVNVRFLLAIQALEAFHRTIQPSPLMDEADHKALQAALVSAIPTSTSKEMAEKLRTTLLFTNEPSLRQRLRTLFKDIQERYGDSAPKFNVKNFIGSVVDTRNYYTHYVAELEENSLDPGGLHHESERISMILTVLFLERIGVPVAKIAENLGRHRSFERLWSEE